MIADQSIHSFPPPDVLICAGTGVQEGLMELKDEIVIRAPRDVVYDALNDPEILRQCIPGCEELVKHSDTELEAKVVLKIGPVKAKFGGNVTLFPEAPPERFSLKGEGNGGAAGFAKGGASVVLEEHPEGTLLRYDASADIGGKLAQLGNRLVQGTAKKLAGNFFESFAKKVGTPA
jgi:carbon monoxide dehydrogenase subunit G